MRKAAFLISVLAALLFLFGMPFAQLGELPTAAASLCGALTSLLPIAGMLMVIAAAVVYALGQIMGAETRARANVWATACIGGALMAFLIVAVAPPVLGAIYGGTLSCSSSGTDGSVPSPACSSHGIDTCSSFSGCSVTGGYCYGNGYCNNDNPDLCAELSDGCHFEFDCPEAYCCKPNGVCDGLGQSSCTANYCSWNPQGCSGTPTS